MSLVRSNPWAFMPLSVEEVDEIREVRREGRGSRERETYRRRGR